MTFSNCTLTGTEYLSDIQYRRCFPDDSFACWAFQDHCSCGLRQHCDFPTPALSAATLPLIIANSSNMPSVNSETTIPPRHGQRFKPDNELLPLNHQCYKHCTKKSQYM